MIWCEEKHTFSNFKSQGLIQFSVGIELIGPRKLSIVATCSSIFQHYYQNCAVITGNGHLIAFFCFAVFGHLENFDNIRREYSSVRNMFSFSIVIQRIRDYSVSKPQL